MTKEENLKRLEHLRNIVTRLPHKPGTYQFYDENHVIIYVGVAKRCSVDAPTVSDYLPLSSPRVLFIKVYERSCFT